MIAGRATLSLLLALAATWTWANPAAASPAAPAQLEVLGGGGWSHELGFTLVWSPDPAAPPPLAAHYLIEDQAGTTVAGPERVELITGAHTLEISVPPVAGVYTAAVWLEDGGGAEGPASTVNLRFDRERPGRVEPAAPPGWLGRAELPHLVRLSHPEGAVPISGVRGYAVSVGPELESSPCADALICIDAETDLRGGVEDDTLALADLPEGRSYVHAVAVSGSGVRSELPGHAELLVDRTDPVTTLAGAPSGWANGPVALRASATDALSGMTPAGDGAPFTAIRIDDRVPVTAPGDAVETTVISEGVHAVSFYARDAAGNVDDGADANGVANHPPASRVVRIDRRPPAVAFLGSIDPTEPEAIAARVVDGLSGPDPRRGEIAVRRAGTGDRFRALPTLGAGGMLLAHWDSEAYPEGDYEFRATGRDAAGNAASTTRRANGTPMVLPNPLKPQSSIVAGYLRRRGGLRHGSRIVHRGRRVRFGGRLRIASDAPLGGRPIVVVETFDAGARRAHRSTRVRTDRRGRFSLQLQRGPGRQVLATFAGTATSTSAISRPLRLGVRSGVRMRASARRARVGGRPIVFRGRLAHAPGEVPPGGASRAAAVPRHRASLE